MQAVYICPAQSGGKTGSNGESSKVMENLVTHQEPELFKVRRMSLEFHSKRPCQAEYPAHPLRGRKRWQRKQQIDQTVTPQEETVHHISVEAVQGALLTRLERKISPHDGIRR